MMNRYKAALLLIAAGVSCQAEDQDPNKKTQRIEIDQTIRQKDLPENKKEFLMFLGVTAVTVGAVAGLLWISEAAANRERAERERRYREHGLVSFFL